jgi:hypothetical protein
VRQPRMNGDPTDAQFDGSARLVDIYSARVVVHMETPATELLCLRAAGPIAAAAYRAKPTTFIANASES